MSSMEDYSKMTVAQLKDELAKRELNATGKKADLIKRLQGWSKAARRAGCANTACSPRPLPWCTAYSPRLPPHPCQVRLVASRDCSAPKWPRANARPPASHVLLLHRPTDQFPAHLWPSLRSGVSAARQWFARERLAALAFLRDLGARHLANAPAGLGGGRLRVGWPRSARRWRYS